MDIKIDSFTSSTLTQIEKIAQFDIPAFEATLKANGIAHLRPTSLEIFQVNLGKMCNQTCKHCHVDAGPHRKEAMTKALMEACLVAIQKSGATTVDLTGGAPEMHPHFRWFVEQIRALGAIRILVRCNLTIILANKKFYDLPEFFKTNNVEVISSLPFYTANKTDSQRGNGVFEKSIKALQQLNAVGYGKPKTGLILNLVYNPSGAFLPANQNALELDFKQKLRANYDIYFNQLFAITNLPISRFLDYLHLSGNLDTYIHKLVDAFNPAAANGVMCKNTVSIGYDGLVYDCDFNQMLDLTIDAPHIHLEQIDWSEIQNRNIVTNKHCYGCTAGAGSSCGGAVA